MTVVTPLASPEVFRPSGHPVVWFVAMVTGLAITLCLTWWAGLVAARATIVSYDITRGPSSINGFDLAVVNDGPLAVEIVGAGLTGSPARSVKPVRLGSGERTVVHVSVESGDCHDRLLRVDVRSPVGFVRTVELPGSHLGGWCAL